MDLLEDYWVNYDTQGGPGGTSDNWVMLQREYSVESFWQHKLHDCFVKVFNTDVNLVGLYHFVICGDGS